MQHASAYQISVPVLAPDRSAFALNIDRFVGTMIEKKLGGISCRVTTATYFYRPPVWCMSAHNWPHSRHRYGKPLRVTAQSAAIWKTIVTSRPCVSIDYSIKCSISDVTHAQIRRRLGHFRQSFHSNCLLFQWNRFYLWDRSEERQSDDINTYFLRQCMIICACANAHRWPSRPERKTGSAPVREML